MTQHQSFFCNLAPLLYRFHCFPRYFVFLFSIVLCELCLLHQLGPNMFLPPVDYCNGSGLKTIISFCNWIDSRTFHDNFQFIVLNNCTFLDPIQFLHHAGHQIETLLRRSCLWNRKPTCDHRNFTPIMTSMAACHTFYSGKIDDFERCFCFVVSFLCFAERLCPHINMYLFFHRK